MTFQEDGRFYIRGIVSVGASKIDRIANKLVCDSTKYTVFTDVAQYLPWINENTAIHHGAKRTQPIRSQAQQGRKQLRISINI